SGEEFTVEVRGAFDDVEDISAVPTPFTPACDGHPFGPDRWADCRARRQTRGCRCDRPDRADPVRIREKRDPARFRGATPRVPGADGPLLARARRPRLVWRAHTATAQPQPRHDLDDAARRIQAVLCWRLRRRFRPE